MELHVAVDMVFNWAGDEISLVKMPFRVGAGFGSEGFFLKESGANGDFGMIGLA